MISRDVVLILSTVGLVQAVCISLYLLTLPKGNRFANAVLGWLILGLTTRIAKSVIEYYVTMSLFYRHLGLAGIFIVGPLLLLYGKVLLEKKDRVHPKDRLHYIPLLAFLVITLTDIPAKIGAHSFGYLVVIIHLGVYLAACWIYLYRHHNHVPYRSGYWYKLVVTGITLIWLVYFLTFIRIVPFYLAGAFLYSFLIYAFTYLFLRLDKSSPEKYANYDVDVRQLTAIRERLDQLFIATEIFRETSVTLSSVAGRLAVNERELSQAINETTGRNFSEYVNLFRVERAKKLLTNPDTASNKLASIAYDSGFGNLTSFNASFKKETGTTPSEYRKNQHVSIQ